jgi:hypothetical protein
MLLSVAKLMVLERMSTYGAQQGEVMRRRLIFGGRVVLTVVFLGNSVGLAASAAAAVYLQKSSAASSTASAYFAANNTEVALQYLTSAMEQNRFAASIVSVQRFCEVLVLLLIITAFVVVAIICVARLNSALALLNTAGPDMAATMHIQQRAVDDAKALGKQMRREVIVSATLLLPHTYLNHLY